MSTKHKLLRSVKTTMRSTQSVQTVKGSSLFVDGPLIIFIFSYLSHWVKHFHDPTVCKDRKDSSWSVVGLYTTGPLQAKQK